MLDMGGVGVAVSSIVSIIFNIVCLLLHQKQLLNSLLLVFVPVPFTTVIHRRLPKLASI